MVNGELPPRVKKDAFALILEFIRSRPPLVPVGQRRLRQLPPKEPPLHERLMDAIRQQHRLRHVTTRYSSILDYGWSFSKFAWPLRNLHGFRFSSGKPRLVCRSLTRHSVVAVGELPRVGLWGQNSIRVASAILPMFCPSFHDHCSLMNASLRLWSRSAAGFSVAEFRKTNAAELELVSEFRAGMICPV